MLKKLVDIKKGPIGKTIDTGLPNISQFKLDYSNQRRKNDKKYIA